MVELRPMGLDFFGVAEERVLNEGEKRILNRPEILRPALTENLGHRVAFVWWKLGDVNRKDPLQISVKQKQRIVKCVDGTFEICLVCFAPVQLDFN
jgi:hypothetical protein